MSFRYDTDAELNIKPGSTVSGTIVHMKETSLILDVHLSKGIVKGVLAYNQLSDNPGLPPKRELVVNLPYQVSMGVDLKYLFLISQKEMTKMAV